MLKQDSKNLELKLPRLSNAEFDYVSQLAKRSGVPLNHCPTCGAKPIEVVEGVTGWENGTYRYQGEEHECDCDFQMKMRKHYLLANIGDQYQRLDWREYNRDDDVKVAVACYLENWNNYKRNGIGIEFASKSQGTGKTFAATYIGKELIKRGERVFFIPFSDVIGVLSRARSDWEYLYNRMYDSNVLILDEVQPPYSDAQHALFSDNLEQLIRNRTNFNMVTLMTTNLTEEELMEEYPRAYSLIQLKQIRIPMTGSDFRQSVELDDIEIDYANEIRPIT